MDKLTRGRRPLRSQITRLANEVTELCGKVPVDKKQLRVNDELLDKAMQELEKWDERVKDQLVEDNVDEAGEEEEFRSIERYKRTYLTAKSEIEEALGAPSMIRGSEGSVDGEGRKRKYKLPELRMRTFGGNLKDWLGWWSHFEKIHLDDEMHASDKFDYLAQCMQAGSEAKELVDSYPQTEENYMLAVQALKERFGREDLLLQVYVRELLTLVIGNVTKKEKLPLAQLYLKLESHLRSLEALKLDKADPATWLFPLVESSLSAETLRAWQRSPLAKEDGAKRDPPKSRLEILMEFVKTEVQGEQQIALAQQGFQGDVGKASVDKMKPRVSGGKAFESLPAVSSLVTTQYRGCYFCGRLHETGRCFKAPGMSIEEKMKIVRDNKLCFLCLGPGHSQQQCKLEAKCKNCGKGHHVFLCFKNGGLANVSTKRSGNPNFLPVGKRVKISGTKADESETPAKFQQNSNQCSDTVLLNTIKVQMEDLKGGLLTVRLIGDSASQRSYGISRTLSLVKSDRLEHEWIHNIIFGGKLTAPKEIAKHGVAIIGFNGVRMTVELLEKKSVTGLIQEVPDGPWVKDFEELGVTFPDLGNGVSEADVLIGNDYWGAIRTGNMVKLPNGLVAEETIFGWSLGGPVPKTTVIAMAAATVTVSPHDISRLWQLEAIGIRDPIEAKSLEQLQSEAIKDFECTVAREDSGRYVVALPWISGAKIRVTNRAIAEMRLKAATYKLKKTGKFSDYSEVFTAWEKEGIIKRVPGDPMDGHYIPHRPVFKESSTTPVRPVFDASCKQGRNQSLNECLHKGPNLIELIPAMVLRFCEKRIGVSADLRKAFQMIRVRAEDQLFQRFLWWDDQGCFKLVVYQHDRVVFGMNCSPFILGATIQHHLNKATDREMAEKMRRMFYVDNLLASLDKEEEVLEFKERCSSVMKEAEMELRQWAFSLGNCRHAMQGASGAESEREMGILGMRWHRVEDTLSCVVKDFVFEDRVTKRDMLSLVAQVFDPMGFLCPALLVPKLCVQEVWARKTGWDEEVPEEVKSRFLKWVGELPHLRSVKIQRFSQVVNATSREIHVMVDSSRDGMAAVAFLRTELHGEVSVQFLLAKARLTPVKRPTIPRSELVSCVIGARIARTICEALDVSSECFTFWSDSATALAWIKRNGDWGVFVQNRVNEILGVSRVEQWRHVPGNLNAADLPSRGCNPLQLLRSKWWEGPVWLRGDKSGFPHTTPEVDDGVVCGEIRKCSVLTTAVKFVTPRFSSYRKNVAVWGWALRFVGACSRKRKLRKQEKCVVSCKPYLTVGELREAEKIVIKTIQEESFPEDCREIGGIALAKDEEGILRVRTRLTNRRDKEDFINPIVLPKAHPLVEQLVSEVHLHNCHGGAALLRSKLREKYWIIHSRKVVKKVVRSCVRCRRHAAKCVEAEPSTLPAGRVEDGVPFATTGVDLAGPLVLRDGGKAWVVLYTCAVYRAVFLDVVTSLSTEAFLGSLQRFVSMHGRMNTLYSDNGTNFVGARNLFDQLDWREVEEQCGVKQINWILNPPTASWWGGFWERLVRTVKDLLKRMLGRSKLCYDGLRTVLAGVTSTINDRPLTLVTEDSEELVPLTPAMFIRGGGFGHLPEPVDAAGLRENYRRMTERMVLLQQRFRKEYLSLLVMHSGPKVHGAIKTGDVVLVGADNKKRYEWPLGLVVKVLPGKDGHTRRVLVKTASGVLDRPVQRLFPLEVSDSSEVSKVEVTRSGRVTRQPARYGQWIYQVV